MGDLEDDLRTRLEAEAIADQDLFDRIEAIEDTVIEEYLAGDLPRSESKIFDETLDTVSGRRRRVELVRALAARTRHSAEASNVVSIGAGVRYASHARLAIAAGFAAAAITAIIFVQSRQTASEVNPPVPEIAQAPAPVPALIPDIAVPAPETSSAIAARRPGKPILAAPTRPIDSIAAASVVTFVLTSGTSRSGDTGRILDLASGIKAVDLQIAVDDDEYSHYNAELRASDGSTAASRREVPVTALDGAPVITVSVPASALHDGRYELVLAGVHERGAEEVAYIEFDVRKR
ncbi:MAG: hypothetical protein ACSLFQ_22075 [Thermoanaerobaculia bacterium]